MFARALWVVAVVVVAVVGAARAAGQIVVPGADGSDGVFMPMASVTIDLNMAAEAPWNGVNPNPGMGRGVYDPEQWAIVFRYESVTIPAGVTVTFTNRQCNNAPVVWLVSGNVTINGVVNLDGQAGSGSLPFARPGPGGFPGGRSYVSSNDPGSAGFGPGGARFDFDFNVEIGVWGAASHATPGGGSSGPVYGGTRIIPLMGGSGGTARYRNDGRNLCPMSGTCDCGGCTAVLHPGAGGGALLIASGNRIALGTDGRIVARGGASSSGCCQGLRGSGGSGGAIRLIAHEVMASGSPSTVYLHALGGDNASSGYAGGDGRIRIEANINPLQPNQTNPVYGFNSPGAMATLWPGNLTPSVRIISVGDHLIPVDPCGGFTFGAHDAVVTSASDGVCVELETRNVPITAVVQVRFIPASGADYTVDATRVSGGQSMAVWRITAADFPEGGGLPENFTVLQAVVLNP